MMLLYKQYEFMKQVFCAYVYFKKHKQHKCIPASNLPLLKSRCSEEKKLGDLSTRPLAEFIEMWGNAFVKCESERQCE